MVAEAAQSLTLQKKYRALCDAIQSYEALAIAFSGGVDSTLLLDVAHEVLGKNVLAITGQTPSVPVREIEATKKFCVRADIRHVVVDTHEFDIPGFNRNPVNRCYLCKKAMLVQFLQTAQEAGIFVLAEGSNLDDDGDVRPGRKAVDELRVVSPLCDAQLTKQDVRELAQMRNLDVWDKPALACLNTRFAYGDYITLEKLVMVDEAEEAVRAAGARQVRVRVEGGSARIEVAPEDIGRIAQPTIRQEIVAKLKQLGFANVSLDLQGYRTGSMNERVKKVE